MLSPIKYYTSGFYIIYLMIKSNHLPGLLILSESSSESESDFEYLLNSIFWVIIKFYLSNTLDPIKNL